MIEAVTLRKKELAFWALMIVLVISSTLIIRSFLFTLYIVKGTSMEPTLRDNQLVFVNKLIYLIRDPLRGEVVVYAHSPIDYNKRIIAVAGDRLEIFNDQLYINGTIVDEPYLDAAKVELPSKVKMTEDFGPIDVPEGHVFIVGDNRFVSNDSRYFGPVPVNKIKGKIEFYLWPVDLFGSRIN